MCELVAALSIASQAMSFAGQAAAADEQNAARARNRAAAQADYNRQLENEQRNYVAESRATQQKGFDEVLKARDAKGRARAQAATQGAAGVSVDAVLNEITGVGARNLSRIEDEKEVNEINYDNRVDSAYATAQSRINANQPVSGPNPLGLAINVGTTLAKYAG